MKKFLIKAVAFFLILALIFVPFAMVVDPYNIFHADKLVDNGVEPNKNYVKMYHVLHNPEMYDSFLFGSSRVGFIDVSKLTDGNYYDMMYSEGVPAEQLDNLKVMISHGIIPKNVTIGVDDISYFVDPALHTNQLYRLNFPWNGSITDKLGFYLRYFDLITLSQSLHVLRNHKINDPDYAKRLLTTGTENLQIPTGFNYDGAEAWWSSYYYPREESLNEIKEIKDICEKYNIKLRVFTNPLNALTYTKDINNGYLVFLEELADVTDYWNFSGYNNVTMDYDNYYETSHYCPAVGDKIIDAVYNGKTDPDLLAQGFGMYVTKDNKEELIKLLRDQAINYDLPVNTYTDTINKDKTDNTPVDEITQDEADADLSEALEGTGCRAIFEDMVTNDGKDLYTYSVRDPDNEPISQMLAVDAVSGTVEVYDPETGDVSDYSSFQYYDKASEHENISWDGTFELGGLSVVMSGYDGSTFEFVIRDKDKEVLNGKAAVSDDTASWKSDDGEESLSFTMADAETLQMMEDGSLGLSGQYIQNKK